MRRMLTALLIGLCTAGVAFGQNDQPQVSGAELAPPGGAAATPKAKENKSETPALAPAPAPAPKQETKPAENGDAADRPATTPKQEVKNKQATHQPSSGRVAAFWFIVPGK